MNSIIKFNRPLANVLVLALLVFMLPANVLADKYRARITKITPESATGDVIIQVKPGKNEDAFTGKARVMLVGTDPGTNRALATLLTAVSLNAEVIVEVANPPSSDDIQVITSVGLISP